MKRTLMLLGVLLTFSIFMHSCMNFRTNDKKTQKIFEKKGQQITIEMVNNMRIIKTINDSEKAVLFIHGTPGSADAYYDYLADTLLVKEATLITYDRPGYGYSDYRNSLTSIKDQAEAIKKVIEKYKEVYVVGHSYGGPIAACLALRSSNVQGVLLVAPAMYPHREKFTGMAKLGDSFVGRLFSSKAMHVASEEKLAHEGSLRSLENEWGTLSCKMIHMHAKDDKIVPYENLNYVKETFTAASLDTISLNEGNHFLPWNNFERVRSNVFKLIHSN